MNTATRTTGTFVLAEAPSASRAGVTHSISVWGAIVCSCEDNRLRRRDCRHVREYLNMKENDAALIEELEILEQAAAEIRLRLRY